MGNFTAILAARHALLERQGWDVEARGLFGAPPLRVVVGQEVHASMLKALALAGLGRERVERVPVDGQGRIRAEALPPLDDRTIVCIQAGNVNTGAFDPVGPICEAARPAGAWVHVDGAFGLWAAASPERAELVAGLDQASSWSADAHKYLNVPYDCGIVVCREGPQLRAALTGTASYLIRQSEAEPSDHTPEYSRRARAVEVWAALRSLGRAGVAALVERTCGHARRFAAGLSEAGYEVLNEVVLNQVLVSFGEPEVTREVIRRVQDDGTCWAGGSVWQGHTAMRISVSCWATTAADVDRSLEAILRIAGQVTGRGSPSGDRSFPL
jgi:glutamate/tyrosine decarboxylase-like PLP-dependent enzyme